MFVTSMSTGSFTTRALEKKRKQEIAFGCVILKKKNLTEKIFEKRQLKVNQSEIYTSKVYLP
jgi:hypothetical protein